jgi:DNA replication protein DnaC
MQVGPCRYCGLPVEVDDALIAREGQRVMIGLDSVEAERCQNAILKEQKRLGPQINHGKCVLHFQEQGAIASRLKIQNQRAVRYERACPFKGENRTVIAEMPFRGCDVVTSAFHVANRSVTLVGPTGIAKTRLAWLLIEKPFMEGKEVRVFTHISLKMALFEKAKRSQAEMAIFVRELIACDILLIDDLGKADMARGEHGLQIEEQTFHILDSRLGNPSVRTILTSNDDGESLKARMTPDRGEPLLRRIRELTACFTG